MNIRNLMKNIEAEAQGKTSEIGLQSRRVWMQNMGLVTATGAVLWACGDDDNKATASCNTELTLDQKKTDAEIVKVALALEYEAIELYKGAAGISAIWTEAAHAFAPTFLAVAGEFLKHHQAHAKSLEGVLTALADTGVTAPAKPGAEVFDPYGGAAAVTALTGLEGLKVILQVAAERELNAANIYFAKSQAKGGFNSRELADASGGLAFDETMHAGVLNAAALAIGVTGITAANIAPAGSNKASPFSSVRSAT